MNTQSIIQFQVFNAIHAYLYHEKNTIKLKVPDLKSEVNVYLYGFPDTFSDEASQLEIQASGYQTAYDVLNQLYQKMEIAPVSDEDIAQGFSDTFIHIAFDGDSTAEMKKYGRKKIPQVFLIFFCCENSAEMNSFRVLHDTGYFVHYIKSLLQSNYIEPLQPGLALKNAQETDARFAIRSELEIKGVQALETVLYALCAHLKIELPTNVKPRPTSVTTPEKVSMATLKAYLKLATRDGLDQETLNSEAKKLFALYKKRLKKVDEEDYDAYFEFMASINFWNIDWKFSAEDAEYGISALMDNDFKFTYPAETYSANLIPFMQSQLEKSGLALMSFDTLGDSYAFFLVNKKDLARLLVLSDLLNLRIELASEVG
ncbi:MAG: hypothetical protein WBP13_03675 [Methylophilaceae bacterium]